MRDVVIPREPEEQGGHGVDDALRADLQREARAAGLFAPTVAPAYGGLGLDVRGQAVVLEEAGYSLLGPLALNCAAPDEGNMHLLAEVATEAQKARYLEPLTAGEVRSCFAMTEPAPGAGSDPSMLATVAERADGGWRINGRKWFITGAEDAAFAICMARTEQAIERGRGATMFLVDAGNPGFQVVRLIETIDRAFAGGHAEVRLRRLLRGGRRGARRGRARLRLRAGAARAGAADALHALAGARPPGARPRARPRQRAAGVRAGAGRPRHGPAHDRRVGDRPRDARGC